MFYEVMIYLGALIGVVSTPNPLAEKPIQEEIRVEDFLKTQQEENSELISVKDIEQVSTEICPQLEVTKQESMTNDLLVKSEPTLGSESSEKISSLTIDVSLNECFSSSSQVPKVEEVKKELSKSTFTSNLLHLPACKAHSDLLSLIVAENLAEIQLKLESAMEEFPPEAIQDINVIIKIFEESCPGFALKEKEPLEERYYEAIKALDQSLVRAEVNYKQAIKKGLSAEVCALFKERLDQIEANRRSQIEEIQRQIDLLHFQAEAVRKEETRQNLESLARVLTFDFDELTDPQLEGYLSNRVQYDVDRMQPLKRHLLSSLPSIEHFVHLYFSGFIEERFIDEFFQKNIRLVLIILLKALETDRIW